MTNRFLISVAAAALVAGTGIANAQGAGNMGPQGGGGSAVQQSAPSAGGSAAQHREAAPSPGMTAGQSEKVAPGGKAQQNTSSDSDRMGQGGKDMKAEGREGWDKSTVGQAPDKSGTSTKGRENNMGAQRGEDRMNAQDQKGSMDTNRAQSNQNSQTTTGNAATSARVAAPPPEKRTQIVSAIKSERIQETNINVNVSVGTVLPSSVTFHQLPPRIVEIYPEWRGYEVVLIHGRYVIVRPQTREIVYVIES